METNRTFFQLVTVGPISDWFTQTTSPSSMPPFETTSFSTDVIVPQETDEDNSLDRWERPTTKDNGDQFEITDNEIVPNNGRGSRIYDMQRPEEVTSENLWERTEVLAGQSYFWIWIHFTSNWGPIKILIPFLALSSCNSMWSSWFPVCCFPPPPPGLPYEEERWRQLWAGRRQAFQCTVSQSPHQGVLCLTWNNTDLLREVVIPAGA